MCLLPPSNHNTHTALSQYLGICVLANSPYVQNNRTPCKHVTEGSCLYNAECLHTYGSIRPAGHFAVASKLFALLRLYAQCDVLMLTSNKPSTLLLQGKDRSIIESVAKYVVDEYKNKRKEDIDTSEWERM